MTRATFLTFTSASAFAIGLLAIVGPGVLLEDVKHAQANPVALVMTRTVGVLLIAMAVLTFSVRHHPSSETLRSVLLANLVLQVGILPIDPIAYATGAFSTLGSFLPNTLLHIVLIAGFAYWLAKMPTTLPTSDTK